MITVAVVAVAISKLVLIPLLPGCTQAQICGLSGDGKTVLGYQTGLQKNVAFIWDAKAGSKELGDVSWNMWRAGMPSTEYDSTGNLIDLVGIKPEDVRWARVVAFMNTPKADLKPFKTPWLFGSSADGKVCFGNGISKDGTEGFLWTKAGGAVGIGDLPGGFFYSQVLGLSPEGNWAVGCSKSYDGLTAAVWNKAKGIVALRFKDQDKGFSRALCCSSGAKLIGGEAETARGTEAIVWQPGQDGSFVRSLQGSAVPAGWTLSSVDCVTDTGAAIAGEARNQEGKTRVWIASIVSRQ